MLILQHNGSPEANWLPKLLHTTYDKHLPKAAPNPTKSQVELNSPVAGSPSVTKLTHSSCTGVNTSGTPSSAAMKMATTCRQQQTMLQDPNTRNCKRTLHTARQALTAAKPDRTTLDCHFQAPLDNFGYQNTRMHGQRPSAAG